MTEPLVSVCVCTFNRPRLLRKALESLLELHPATPPYEVIVVDNDEGGSARAVVETLCDEQALATGILRYRIESIRNIARARNLAVASARGEILAFIDDDEVAAPDWLLRLLSTLREHDADAVFGPVNHTFEHDPPDWLVGCGFFNYPVPATGSEIPLEMTRTSNALVRKECFASLDYWFDERLGLSGGEDTDLFRRMIDQGVRCVADEQAHVTEWIPAERMTLRWLLQRTFRYGNWKTLDQHGRNVVGIHRIGDVLKAAAKCSLRISLALGLLPFSRTEAARNMLKASYWTGVFSGALGFRYEEYR